MKVVDPVVPYAPPEQQRYAGVLAMGTRIGLALLVLGFLAYVFEWIPPLVAHETLPALWNQPLSRYLELTGVPTGWGWLNLIDRGDIFNLIGIGVLSGISMLCLAAAAPFYASRGERVYLAICLLEIVVLLLAASGILTSGH